MTLRADLIHPFAEVIAAFDRALPDRRRGVTVLAADANLTAVAKGARVRLVLDAASVIWREIARPGPDVGPDRRADWIEARLEAVSPWAPGAYLWAEAGEGETLRLALTAAAPIRTAEATLRAGGSRLVEVQMGTARLGLAPDLAARRLRRWVMLWLVVMALGLGLAALSLRQIQAAGDAADLASQRLARFAAEGAVQGDRSRAILALAGESARKSLAEPLNRLAASLPLDSHLLTLRLTPDDFQIAGQSASPDAIVPALEAGGFKGVDFAGASALDGATGLFSFTIHGQTRGAP